MTAFLIIQLILTAISVVAAVTAAVISYNTFQRQKTFENENRYFSYKFDKYNLILSYIAELLTNIEDIIEEYYCDTEELNEDDYDEIQNNLDSEINKAEVELLAHAAFIPEKVFKKIEKFKDNLFDSNLISEDGRSTYDSSMANLDEISDHIFVIAEVMRKDLGIDSLNIKLQKRTHPGAKRK